MLPFTEMGTYLVKGIIKGKEVQIDSQNWKHSQDNLKRSSAT